MDKRTLGTWGEKKAAGYLRRRGYRIICTNYVKRGGEIDIIASKDGYIVFAEVKLRKNAGFAQAREFVDSAKQRRIISTALAYIAESNTELQPRFDVIEVYAPQGEHSLGIKIEHLENAFE